MNRLMLRIGLRLIAALALTTYPNAALAQTPEPFVTSPDGRVAVSFRLDDDGQPEYSVRLGGKELLGPSPLGLQTSLASWDRDLTIAETSDVDRIEDHYQLLHGKRRDVPYEANWRMVQLADPEGRQLEIHFQVSNDGLALRYAIPEQSGVDSAVVHRELTGFRFSPDAVSWLMPMDHPQTGWMNTNPSYEGHYVIAQPVGVESPTEVGWSIPALFHDEGAGWALVMESDVDESYVGARLTAEPERGLYRIGFPDRGEGYGPNDPVD
ncbi:MAG TPA: glycoside hydrolase family 97 N-terminal domain-containing protein, partial [Rhodothermales bacterium]